MSEAAERADSAARRAGIDATRSVLLEAPAGSGKTAVLTQRFLKLLCTVEDPLEILAITFTRKAAAEMRARITRALRAQIPDADPAAGELRELAQAALAHAAARGWPLQEEPQILRIQTIDAFNYALAAELPVASRVGGTLVVTETPQALYERAARRTLLAAEADPALQEDARRLFERLDNHWMALERLLAEMLRERGHWLRFVAGEDPQGLCGRVNASLARLTGAYLTGLCERLPEALRRRAARLPGVGELTATAADLAAWKRFAHLVTTKDDWRRQVNAHRLGVAFTDSLQCRSLQELIEELRLIRGAREALLELKGVPPAQLSQEEAATLASLARLLRRAAAELHAEFSLAQRVDYTYLTGAARAALTEAGEPTDLALRTGLRLRHILVDEFQDTSLAQFQLLEMLTVGWEQGDGRTLFVVGDPMQSIYRFRDAEVGLFLKAREAGIGHLRLNALRLRRNFRTVPALVGFCNELFAAIFPPRDELRAGAVAYTESLAARVAQPLLPGIEPVSLRVFPADRLAEARGIAARIAQLRRLDPAGTVAVLVSAHAHAVPIIAALQAAGLEALGVDLVPLKERTVVRDLVQLARALYDLGDRAAWLAVLRAPWCGARLVTLSALSELNDPQLIIEALAEPARLGRCTPQERARLEHVRAILSEALAGRDNAPAANWLEATWVRLGAPDAYAAAELPDARAFFAALAARAAAFEWRGPQDFPTLLEHLHSADTAACANPVQVMTIHRAKGLEFEHVFVPALERVARADARRLLRWVDLPSASGVSDLIIAPVAATGGREEGALNAYLKELLRRRAANERTRLLYVAATRARRSLWLSGSPPASEAGTLKPDRRSLLGQLWPALGQRFQAQVTDSGPPAAGLPAAPLTRLVPGWSAPPLPAALPLVHLPAAHLSAEPPEFSWVGETQRHIGTVVHAWLARLAGAVTLPDAPEIEGQRGAVLAQLKRLAVPQREQARAAERVLEALQRTLADERGRWILSGAHREAYAELALTGVSAGRLRNIVIDRCFVDAGGTRWVIDFKTSRHEGGGLGAFLDEEVERYREQLTAYAGLARSLGPEPVRAGLYFPLLQAFREI